MKSMSVGDEAQLPLGFATKLAYGVGTMGISATGSLLAFCLMFFLTDVAGLSAALASYVLVIGQVSDAISDPIIGMLSDRTQTRWGRRYPWIVIGAVPFGLSFFLLWLIPIQNNDGLLFAYYVVIGIIYKTCYTAVYLPYVSLTPELSQGYNERTNLNSFRFTFAIGSSILAILSIQLAFSKIEFPPYQYLAIGAVGAFLCIVPLYICVLGTHRHVIPNECRRAERMTKNSLSLRQQVRIAFSNRPFLLVVGLYLCSWLAAQITVVVMLYFVISWMQATADVFATFALTVQGTALLMLFVWSRVSQRVGKRTVYFMGTSAWLIAQIGLFNLAPGQIPLMYCWGAIAGLGVSTAYLVPWSMLPDVIELDELQTGQRREGVFYAFMVMVQKIGLAAGIFLVGQALDHAGYIGRVAGQTAASEGIVQPDSALFVIRMAIGPIPTAFLIGGLILAYFYPISPTVHAEIMAKLAQQRRTLAEEKPD
ncbi:MAG: MFS transporter [Leptolyngbyaceae bacterium]|nr:MFS transporter [Leptolyngbyaceae bacterium]